MLNLPKLTLHFDLIERIGDGGSSTVWSIKSKDDKLFACKIPFPDEERFVLIESTYMSRISKYPNTSPFLTFYGLYEHNGSPVMVSELFVGDELEVLIKEGSSKQLSNEEILHIAKCIVEQVVYLNNIGMCHNDIHASNVLYDGNRAVLIDITGDYNDSSCVNSIHAMTTEEYFTRAIKSGMDQCDIIWMRDIFDIGILLRKLVKNDTSYIYHHDYVLDSDKYKISSGSSKLDNVVNSALELDISKRPSAVDLLRYINA